MSGPKHDDVVVVPGDGAPGEHCAVAIAAGGPRVAVVEREDHLLPREPRPLGESIAEALRSDGVQFRLGQSPAAARLDGGDYVAGTVSAPTAVTAG